MIRALSRTQQLCILEQLQRGVRYLDLRVCYVKEKFYTHHFLVGTLLRDDLEAVAAFLRDNPNEIVILDLSHFIGLRDQQHNELGCLLGDLLGPLIAPATIQVSDTISEIIQSQCRVFVLYDAPEPSKGFASVWYENIRKERFDNPWHQFRTADQVLEKFRELGRHESMLFVSQAIITPPENVTGFLGYFKRYTNPLKAAEVLNPRIAGAIQRGEWLPQNIVMLDDVTNCGAIEAIISSLRT